MTIHRDHGIESGWVHPSFKVDDMSGLHNDDPFFVFSINCYTGAFVMNNMGEINASDCFAEAILKHNNGAAGVIAADNESYQNFNETYGWGVMDYLWPQFMPDKNSQLKERCKMPAFANVLGKYRLAESSSDQANWMIYIYHYFGDVFSTMYTEVPRHLTVSHDSFLNARNASFSVTADQGSFIALTVNDEIIGTGVGTGSPLSIPIPTEINGSKLIITVTKQNYFRYEKRIPITNFNTIGDNMNRITDFYLSDNYPNPFNPSTIMKYSLPKTGYVTLTVYDINGRKIRTIIDGLLSAGEKKSVWDGKDSKGIMASGGMYFFQITVKTKNDIYTAVKKGLFLK